MTHADGLLAKAERYLRSARLLEADGDPDSAISRAYYAQFFIAEALLSNLGHSFSSHKAVIAAFGREFALTGRLDPAFHRRLLAAFQKRQIAEYGVDSQITAESIHRLLEETEAFLTAARAWSPPE